MKRLLIVLNWWLEDFTAYPDFVAKVRELQEVVVRHVEAEEFARAQAQRAVLRAGATPEERIQADLKARVAAIDAARTKRKARKR